MLLGFLVPVLLKPEVVITYLRPGDGLNFCTGNQTFLMHYTLSLPNGTEIETTRGGEPLEWQLQTGKLIYGWEIVVPRLSLGQLVSAYIPAPLAYGEKGVKNDDGSWAIEPNQDLVFEMELVGLK